MSRAEVAWQSIMSLWEREDIEVVVRVEVRTVAPVPFQDGYEGIRFSPVAGGSARVTGVMPKEEIWQRAAVSVAFLNALDAASKVMVDVIAPEDES